MFEFQELDPLSKLTVLSGVASLLSLEKSFAEQDARAGFDSISFEQRELRNTLLSSLMDATSGAATSYLVQLGINPSYI